MRSLTNEERWAAWRAGPPEAQVALDAALEGLAHDAQHAGYQWARCALGDGAMPPRIGNLMGESWAELVQARGDLSQAWSGLIPEGGVVCPAGTFVMGSPKEEDRDEYETQHQVTLTRAFVLGRVPVTQRLYQAVMGKNPSCFKTGENAPFRPVECVSWFDAVRFCNALSVRLGLRVAWRIGGGKEPEVRCDVTANGFRLPTEAEWEYAAQSGGDAFKYAGSDNPDEVGWGRDNSDGHTHPVGLKKPNRWGLYDMTGNVWEWVVDWFAEYPGEVVDYVNQQPGPARGVRGSAWERPCKRVSFRGVSQPSTASNYNGFRLARTLP